jgi:hypothetical protein
VKANSYITFSLDIIGLAKLEVKVEGVPLDIALVYMQYLTETADEACIRLFTRVKYLDVNFYKRTKVIQCASSLLDNNFRIFPFEKMLHCEMPKKDWVKYESLGQTFLGKS